MQRAPDRGRRWEGYQEIHHAPVAFHKREELRGAADPDFVYGVKPHSEPRFIGLLLEVPRNPAILIARLL